jgi:hypothetical protein
VPHVPPISSLKYKSRCSTSCSSPNTLPSNTLSLCSYFSVKDGLSHPHHALPSLQIPSCIHLRYVVSFPSRYCELSPIFPDSVKHRFACVEELFAPFMPTRRTTSYQLSAAGHSVRSQLHSVSADTCELSEINLDRNCHWKA